GKSACHWRALVRATPSFCRFVLLIVGEPAVRSTQSARRQSFVRTGRCVCQKLAASLDGLTGFLPCSPRSVHGDCWASGRCDIAVSPVDERSCRNVLGAAVFLSAGMSVPPSFGIPPTLPA